MNKQIVADADPLIAFARINCLEILYKLFEVILITDTVAKELLVDLTRPGAKAVQQAIDNNLISRKSDPDIADLQGIEEILGLGEAKRLLNTRLMLTHYY